MVDNNYTYVTDEANVMDSVKSSKAMANDLFNEVQIARDER